METWSVVVPVLVAVLTGAAIPLLFQLWLTLRSARAVAERLDRVTARLEEGERIDAFLAAMDSLTRAAKQIGDGVKIASTIGAALGPAAAAAVQAWRAGRAPSGEPLRDDAPGREEARGGAAVAATAAAPGEARRKAAG